MKFLAFTTALILATATAPANLPAQDDSPSLKPAESVDARMIMRLIGEGLPDSAFTILDAEEAKNPNDPLVLLLKVRSLREMVSDEDDDRALIAADMEPMHGLLDRAIALCSEAMDHSASDPVYSYYRGRAHLGKAQLHTLTRSYWSAGRAASKAKSDLERFLKSYPDDPDAQGDLGAFLYFADTLPGAMQFLGRLLFIPGGDREKGLSMLNYAAASDGVFKRDYEVTLAAIYVIFEGRMEEGADAWVSLIDRYPYYFRLVEPLGIISPLYPNRMQEFKEIEDDAIARHFSRGMASVNWRLLKSIQYHRTYTNMYFQSPNKALNEFTSMIENAPPRPDWVLPLLLINRAMLFSKIGEVDKARESYEVVRSREDMEHFHDVSKTLSENLAHPVQVIELSSLDFVGFIYDGRFEEARYGLKRFGERYGEDAIYHFYHGELELMSRQFVTAAQAYQASLDVPATGGDQSYQMFAALRLAEIHGHEGRYSTAMDYIDEAFKFNHAEYLLDIMIHARKHYYELLDAGKLTDPPTLLFGRIDNGSAIQPVNSNAR